MKVGVVAPSSVVPEAEFHAGLKTLERIGLSSEVHPSWKRREFFFAGSHAERARAFWEFSNRDDLQILWAARGGYGALHLLPYLEQWTREYGAPSKKLLVGYSDCTGLIEYARGAWNWPALHGPMIAMNAFSKLSPKTFTQIQAMLRADFSQGLRWPKKLQLVGDSLGGPLGEATGVLVGGNLSVLCAMTGTRFAGSFKGGVLVLEDISETPSRIDRMVCQLEQAGRFEGLVSIVLGDFTDCEDRVPVFGVGKKAKPVRPKIPLKRSLVEIFGSLGKRLNIPVWMGAPIGHGPNYMAAPIGARVAISGGTVKVLGWDWSGLQT